MLYELVTLRHAFDANSMKGLVLKILRGSYPAIPNTYSQELKDLISEMLTREPKNRPSIKKLLEKDFLAQRIGPLLTNTLAKHELGNTIIKKVNQYNQLQDGSQILASPMITNVSISQSQVSLHGTPIQNQYQILTDISFQNNNNMIGNQVNSNANSIGPTGINSGNSSQVHSESKKHIKNDSKEILPKSPNIEDDKKGKIIDKTPPTSYQSYVQQQHQQQQQQSIIKKNIGQDSFILDNSNVPIDRVITIN